MKTLADELPVEQARVRDIMQTYRAIGTPGLFALSMMEISMRKADKAAASGDVVGMIRALEELRQYSV